MKMKKFMMILMLVIGAALITSCERMNPSDLEGTWNGIGYSITFSGNSFTINSNGYNGGSYRADKKRNISFKFMSASDSILKGIFERIDRYRISPQGGQLRLYGHNFEVYLTR